MRDLFLQVNSVAVSHFQAQQTNGMFNDQQTIKYLNEKIYNQVLKVLSQEQKSWRSNVFECKSRAGCWFEIVKVYVEGGSAHWPRKQVDGHYRLPPPTLLLRFYPATTWRLRQRVFYFKIYSPTKNHGSDANRRIRGRAKSPPARTD